MLKTRREEAANYSAVFINGKTLRMPIDPSKTITELRWPEFYDVAINSWCAAACPWCYTNATKTGKHFDNIIGKINDYFGSMTVKERPFQCALGGAGEPTSHPEFLDVLKTFSDLGIVPNYTTNGMHITDEMLDATEKYCGGVAVSLHPHISKVWTAAIDRLIERDIKLNVHVVISDKASIDAFRDVYEKYQGKIDYFVLLPHMNVGRGADDGGKEIDYEYLSIALDGIHKNGDLAFGANFYEWLKEKKSYDVSLYPPEIMSKYLIMSDEMPLFNNSFDCQLVKHPHSKV